MMIYIVFLIRTDTTKHGTCQFVAAFDSEEAAKNIVEQMNTPGVLEESLMYVVRPVKVNDIHEGQRLWNERNSY